MNERGFNGRGEEELDRFLMNCALGVLIFTIAFVIYGLTH